MLNIKAENLKSARYILEKETGRQKKKVQAPGRRFNQYAPHGPLLLPPSPLQAQYCNTAVNTKQSNSCAICNSQLPDAVKHGSSH